MACPSRRSTALRKRHALCVEEDTPLSGKRRVTRNKADSSPWGEGAFELCGNAVGTLLGEAVLHHAHERLPTETEGPFDGSLKLLVDDELAISAAPTEVARYQMGRRMLSALVAATSNPAWSVALQSRLLERASASGGSPFSTFHFLQLAWSP